MCARWAGVYGSRSFSAFEPGGGPCLHCLKAVQVIGGALRVHGSGEDRAFVALEHLQPVLDVRGVVPANFRRDLQIGAQEGRCQIGHELTDEASLESSGR